MSVDLLDRPLRALRVSVTDRCNLRCHYCMPEREYAWLPKDTLLTFEEIERLVALFCRVGVEKVRLTGGEPLLRRGLPELVARLSALPAIKDLSLTTNGLHLPELAAPLRAAGLGRITVSLDTLRPERFVAMTRMQGHARVLDAIRTASRVFGQLKLDMVVMRGVNDDELDAMLEFGRSERAEVRFIEYMDVAGATQWTPERVVGRKELLARLAARFGTIEAVGGAAWAPADRFQLPDGTVFGIVASTTTPFCRTCDRSRLTADGVWYTCLYAETGVDLRTRLRGGAPLEELAALVGSTWAARSDRGAEHRLAERDRQASVPVSVLRRDPHLEMHTRGG